MDRDKTREELKIQVKQIKNNLHLLELHMLGNNWSSARLDLDEIQINVTLAHANVMALEALTRGR